MKFEETDVWGFKHAIRGMRNPLDSWEKSDSWIGQDNEYHIGAADMDLAKRLILGGSEHRKFLRQIFVSVDITAPRYWWSEFDTYKIGTVANSCSTMHRGTAYEFTPDMFQGDDEDSDYLTGVILHLNEIRARYQATKDLKYLRQLKKALPESFLQKRTVTMNYENILSMRKQRNGHRLPEWSREFMAWSESLPYIKEFEGVDNKNEKKSS